MFLRRYDFQKAAKKAVLNQKWGMLIELPVGVGKSLVLYDVISSLKGPVFICSFKYVLYQHLFETSVHLPFFNRIFIKKKAELIPRLTKDDIVFMTPEIMSGKLKELCLQQYKLICFDESQMLKNWSSIRAKSAVTFCEMQPKAKKLLLSATPAPENIGELQPQMQCINRKILGRSKTFRSMHERTMMVKGYWKKYYVHEDEIIKRVAPYIFTWPENKLPLPEQKTKRIYLEMPEDLREAYEEFKQTCMLTIPLDELVKTIISTNAHTKLLQICAGFIIDTKATKIAGEIISYKLSDFKAKLKRDMCKDLDCSIIVWGTFRQELKLYSELIKDSKLIIGGTRKGDQIIQDFKDEKFKVLIAHPKCIGAGVSLEVAGAQIAGSIDPSCCLYIQSEGRTRRINQIQDVTRYELVYARTMEAIMLKRVLAKVSKQEQFLDSVLKESLKEEFKL